jgi:hypothetical protein
LFSSPGEAIHYLHENDLIVNDNGRRANDSKGVAKDEAEEEG